MYHFPYLSRITYRSPLLVNEVYPAKIYNDTRWGGFGVDLANHTNTLFGEFKLLNMFFSFSTKHGWQFIYSSTTLSKLIIQTNMYKSGSKNK